MLLKAPPSFKSKPPLYDVGCKDGPVRKMVEGREELEPVPRMRLSMVHCGSNMFVVNLRIDWGSLKWKQTYCTWLWGFNQAA